MSDASIPFDYYRLEKDLDNIETYLSELRYSDHVFEYLDDMTAGLWATLLEGVFSLGSSGGISIVVNFGGTAPFQRTWHLPNVEFGLPFQESKEDEVWRQIRKYEAAAKEWAASNIATIRSMIAPIAHPSESVYLDDLIGPVRDTLARLEDHVSHDFGKLQHSLGNWVGDAAADFAVNFYQPFQHTLESHRRMLSAFAGSLTGARVIVQASQQSLMNVVAASRDALLEQLEFRAQQAAAAREKSVKDALVIVATAFPIFAVEKRWELGLELAGAGASVVGSNMEKRPLTGSTAEELLLALTGAIRVIEINSGEQYEVLRREVQSVLSRMDAIRHASDAKDGRLVPSQPRLVSGTNSSDFYLPAAR